MNTLTQIGVGMFALFVAFSMFSQCSRKSSPTLPSPGAEEQAQVTLKEYSKGLDLDAVTALAKKSKDAAHFEQLLNSEAEAVNNIDLNNDGKVDYINITEYGGGDRRGFSLTTEMSPGKIQEIATIDFEKDGEQGVVQTTGNPSLYGPGSYHHSSFGMSDALLMAWLFSNRSGYSSPYGYGNYPSSYGSGWNRQSEASYTGSMTSRTAGSSVSKSSQPVISQPAASPNAEKMAAKAKALSSPQVSQRSFSGSSSKPSSASGSSSKPSSYGGFGRNSSSGSSRSGGFSGGGK